MGLDGVELVLAVEEHFAIEIPDEVAATLHTPGKLKAFVRERVARGASGACLSQRAFYSLRDAARGLSGSRAGSIGPGTAWAELVPGTGRRRLWQALETRTSLPLPSLVRPRWMPPALVALAAGCAVAAASTVGHELVASFAIAALTFAAVAAAGVWSTMPFATRFPPEHATVGATAASLATGRPARLMRRGEGWSDAEISDAVDWIIEQQLGLSRTEFADDSDFVRDIGID